MSIPDIKEITLDELNPFEGDPSLFLTENPDGLWKKLEFDPTSTIQSPTNVLTLNQNKIVLGSPGQKSGELINPTTFTTGQQFYGPGYIAASAEWPGRGGNVYNNYISAIFGGYFGGDYGFIACNSDIIQIIADGDSGYLFGGTDEDTQDPATQLTFGIDKAGAYNQLSDKSLKHSINPMKDKVLPKLKKLQLSTYGFLAPYEEKDSNDKKRRKAKSFFKKQLGLIADEVTKIMPEITEGLGYFSKKEAETQKADPKLIKLFSPDDKKKTKTKMINMTYLQLYMLKAIQELAEAVDEFKGGK